jgi:hypothetical protein
MFCHRAGGECASAREGRGVLACMHEVFPHHYAMTYLGFATDLRASSMRPLAAMVRRPSSDGTRL